MSLTLAHPWGLMALAAVPAILVLHLFWRRFRPRRVPGLFLWAPDARRTLAGRKRDRLYRTSSLVLELLAAFALAVAAAAPLTVSATPKRHLVVVLDGSASMSATGSDGRTFAEAAAREARSRLAELDDSDEATVIVSGPVTDLAAGPRSARERAMEAADSYLREPGRPGTPFAKTDELDRSIALARELALPEGRVIVLTDTARPPDLVPPEVEYVSVGEARPNVGFVVADRNVRPGLGVRGTPSSRPVGPGEGERVFVGVRNFSDGPVECAVVFRPEGAEEIRVSLLVEPGRTDPITLPVGPGAGVVSAEIEVDPSVNALALDDRVRLVPSRRRAVGAANLLEGVAARALAEALASVPGTGVAPPEEALIVFSHRDAKPAPAAGAWRVFLAGRTGDAALRFAGPYVVARSSALLEDVSFDGVLWTASGDGTPALARPLVSCGDRILACEAGRGPSRSVFLDLDLERSNLAHTAAWPVLISNIVEERRRSLPGIEKVNLALGAVARLRLATLEEEPVLVTSRGRKRLPGAGLRRTLLMRELGPARVLQGRNELAGFQVNFISPEESDLRRLGGTRVAARLDGSSEGRGGDTPTRSQWPVAALAAIALVAAVGDWYVLRLSGGRAGRPIPPASGRGRG